METGEGRMWNCVLVRDCLDWEEDEEEEPCAELGRSRTPACRDGETGGRTGDKVPARAW